jgi:hypothetical protein
MGDDPGDSNDSGAEEGGLYRPEPSEPFRPDQPSQRPEPKDETYRSQADGYGPPVPPSLPPAVPPQSHARKRPAELDDAQRRDLFGGFTMYARGTDPHVIRLHEQIVARLQDYARRLTWS